MHELIKEIRALAQTGLHYAQDVYDRERYSRLADIANRLYAMSSNASIQDIEQFFFDERGYATPKVDLRACVIRAGLVLLVKERSDGKWTLPGGWADQNESPVEGIVREVKEESGYDIEVRSLYAVKDRDRHPYTPKYPVSIYKLFFNATVSGGCPNNNAEISEVRFFDIHSLPQLSEDRVLAEDIFLGFQSFENEHYVVHCD